MSFGVGMVIGFTAGVVIGFIIQFFYMRYLHNKFVKETIEAIKGKKNDHL